MSQRVWAAASVAMKGRTAAAVSFFEFMERSLKGRTPAVCQTRGEGVNRAASRARRSRPKDSRLAGYNNLRHLGYHDSHTDQPDQAGVRSGEARGGASRHFAGRTSTSLPADGDPRR